MGWWQDLKDRYETVLERYGMVAIGTYFALFFGTWGMFGVLIQYGVDVQAMLEPLVNLFGSWVGTVGTVGGAYAATKVTQPLRIAATLLLTPAVDRVVQMVRGSTASA